MPRQPKKPSLSLHAPSGQARVWINGRYHYCGRWGTPEAQDEYERLVGEWFRGQDLESRRLTIDELALLYVDHADRYYRKNGEPTGESKNVRYALRYAIKLFGATRVADFGPLRLKAARQAMIEHGLTRKRINRDVARIVAMFKWGVENEQVPVHVYQALRTVAGLRRGRTEARGVGAGQGGA
jgi:hypothetical protein